MQEKKIGAGVGVIIMNKEGKVLLGLRHRDLKKADSELSGEGTWTFPGGKMDFQESFEESAIRETAEECGIKLLNPKVICVNNDMTSTAHFITVGLFCDDYEGEVQVLEPDKITEWKWFSLDNLPDNVFMPTRKMIDNYKEGKFYIQQ